tara:strand:- start:1622 stop:2296 length:675 start_codon:yes stop_codon:yes gene_type:complete
MQKINLIIPSKEKIEHLYKIISPLLRRKEINKIILVLNEKNKKKFIKNKKLKIIVQKKSGYGSAIKEGFKISKSKFSCIFNADGSFNANDLPSMIKLSKQNDFIYASRYMKGAGSEDDTMITLIGNFVFSLMGRVLLNVKLTDILYTFVLCNTKKFNKLNIVSYDFRFCIELPYKVSQNKFTYTELKSKEFKRKFGEKNVNELVDGFLILIEVLRCFLKRITKI